MHSKQPQKVPTPPWGGGGGGKREREREREREQTDADLWIFNNSSQPAKQMYRLTIVGCRSAIVVSLYSAGWSSRDWNVINEYS